MPNNSHQDNSGNMQGGVEPNPKTVFHESVDWDGRHNTPVRHFLNWTERVTLALETPINKIVGDAPFNPLYHTGTITVFLLIIILFTGVYLTMFYQFGFATSYDAVRRIEANFVGRVVRALHRYASGTAVITTLLHAWRTFFQDRFRDARWLAWLSGVLMTVGIWFVGVTGYWLIWDERAQILNQTLINILQNSSFGKSFLINLLVTQEAGTGWIFILLVLTAHLLLSLFIGLGFWYFHVIRLNRPKILPPRYWMWVTTGLLVAASILVPVGMLPIADPTKILGQTPIDWFYLFYLPAALNWSPGLLWGGVTLIIAVFSAIPWLLARKPLEPIVVHDELCTGCALCAKDCPYDALEMVEREPGHRHKYLAVANPVNCVSCGICIGSCPTRALTLGDQPAEPLWETAVALAAQSTENPIKVVFTCERHVLQGAKPYLDGKPHIEDGKQIETIPLTCVGMAHPNMATQALEAGAAEVQFIGCPPEDCASREGNLWLAQRLNRERLPKLKKKHIGAPITTDWLPPNNFAQALKAKTHAALATTYDFAINKSNWSKLIPGILLLVVALAVQVWLSDIPFTPAGADQSQIEIALNHRSGYPLRDLETGVEPDAASDAPTRLLLEVDGQIVLDKTYEMTGKRDMALAYEQISLPPGEHQVRLTMFDRSDSFLAQVLFAETAVFTPGQVLPLHFIDSRPGPDPEAGEELYYENSLGTNAACRICHSLDKDVVLVGPSFYGIATRAAGRVPGMTAEEYLYQSIIDPNAYVVEEFPAGQMVPNLGEILTQEQIEDLIAFLMTME
ncbi:MAG: hydrogenase iron-sulfur subunit [Chloroflexi bacterium]|nr:hydrogenase iron-sulfur subunit [Chloroflexota bacterium]